MSKGSKQRPGEGYQEAYARIFGEKKRERYVPPPVTVDRNKDDDRVFAIMHGNKENFTIEKALAVFSEIPRRPLPGDKPKE